ncbi:MAG: type II toxin-antitoxin system RatA family toxin [Robiginitomaculum sp.]
MPKTVIRKRLAHSPADMMAFVTDIESYPKFINFISAIRIVGPRRATDNGERFNAEMTIRYKMISESFKCVVDIDNVNNRVKVTKADKSGAVKTLLNDWTFHELPDGSTLLDFVIDVTLKSMPLNFIAKQKFPEVSGKIMAVFERRAAQLSKKIGNDSPDGGFDLAQQASKLGLRKRRI